MLKKTITYDDIDGNSVTEDFYFNLTQAEIIEMQLSVPGEGGLEEKMVVAVKNSDKAAIIYYLKLLVGQSFGRRSGEDGKRFIKKEEFTEEFFSSEAYSTLFMSFFEDPDAASAFVNGVMPSKLLAEANKLQETKNIETQMGLPANDVLGDEKNLPAYIREGREPTKQELSKMSPEELQAAFRNRMANVTTK